MIRNKKAGFPLKNLLFLFAKIIIVDKSTLVLYNILAKKLTCQLICGRTISEKKRYKNDKPL